MKRILLSNDDGVHATGLRTLKTRLETVGEVSVMAPLTEQSAASHALTLHHPLRVKQLRPREYAVEGTPTDCVMLAINEFLDHPPDLVVSGINHGPNMGEDVLYSGTVAAAMEGAILGVPSMAVSLASWQPDGFEAAADIAAHLAAQFLTRDLPSRFLVSVNVPAVPRDRIRGLRITRLGSRVYNDAIIRKTDPRGRDYFWIGGAEPSWESSPDTDFAAVEAGYVSVTPLLMDLTDPERLGFLGGLELGLP